MIEHRNHIKACSTRLSLECLNVHPSVITVRVICDGLSLDLAEYMYGRDEIKTRLRG